MFDEKQHNTRFLLMGFLLASVFLSVAAQQSPKPPALGTYERNPRYLLNSGDVIDVQYRYTPEYNQTVTIQPDGFVSLEIIGDVKVGGLNLEQAHTLLVKKAGARLKDPEVTLILKEFQKPYFVVAGEVGTPGKFDMREKTTALQAVMLAGGFKPTARPSQVLLFRRINSETAEVKVLNLNDIKRSSDLEADLALEAGDMLFVPQSKLTKIERYIKLANIGFYFNPLDVVHH